METHYGHVLKDLILLRCQFLKWYTDWFNAILIKIPKTSSCRNTQAHPKSHMKSHETLNSQNNLEKEKQSWGLTFGFQNLLQSYNNESSVTGIKADI
jgi:hypothetical protein